MFRVAIVAIISSLLLTISLQAQPNEVYFKFEYETRKELAELTRLISIANVKDNTIYAYANNDQFDHFKTLGYDYTVLPHPSSLNTPRMADDKDAILDWDAYPTYTAYLSMMDDYQRIYPGLCEIVNIGTTVEGRQLLFARLSANIDTEEDEPEVMYSSSMHGNETTGYVLMLRMIDYLLSNYGTDAQITYLLDNSEIWINPLANPDGTYAGGNHTVNDATRSNSNGVDLNRNFADPDDGPHPDGYAWQPETIAMMDFFDVQSFVISANMHGGVEVLNYPWDTWARLHPDNNWWIDVCREYADSAQANSPSGYMTYLNNGITNGYAWYPVSGGRQDYINYWRGCREVTLELSDDYILPEYLLPEYWDYNRGALMTYMEQAFYGIRGIVTDSETGLPIQATISVIGHDADSSEVYTDPDIGDYHRMIEAGTYSLRFTSLGYIQQTVTGITAIDRNTIIVNVALEPLSDDPILQFYNHDAGQVDSGDSVAMSITLVNNGGGNANSINATLSTEDEYAAIFQSSSSYPNISALGGTGASNSDYEFHVSYTCPEAHLVPFRLDITADGGYVDSAFFNILVNVEVEDFESGDFLTYPWQMQGDADWAITSSDVYEGVYSAKSGSITHYDNSVMLVQYEVTSPDTISFYYKVSSEPTYDFLRFYIDTQMMDEWSGEVGWEQAVYPVSEGIHTFKWEYEKDRSVSDGGDCGWIDYIEFPTNRQVVEIVTTFLPDWTIDQPYSQQLEASGGAGELTWSDFGNDLAGTGLSLTSTGLVTGTPSSAGPINFTARVEDQSSDSDDRQFEFSINPALLITTDDLPDWTADHPYSQQLQSTGGTGEKVWSDDGDSLDGTGLTLSSTGLVSGTPLSAGAISFTASIEDATGASDNALFDFTINNALLITTESLPDWTVGIFYSYQLEATGGTGSNTWTDLNGDLAETDLTISDGGLLVGVPTAVGPISFTANIEDEIGASDQQPLDFTINTTPLITTDFLPNGHVGGAYSFQLDATGGTGMLTWADSEGDLEGTGLALSSDGLLTGTPANDDLITFTAIVTDVPGAEDIQEFSLVVEYSFIAGDANGDGMVIGSDVTYLVQYFRGQNDPPDPLLAGDANGDCLVIGSDVTYLITYFRGLGEPPVYGDCPPPAFLRGQ
ncbi:MAG: hypothetical protein GY839_15085 [candidate division Zixibacteria bacterium]|nr:hypothetical protein [candidate division Zixibacteria bacterium]